MVRASTSAVTPQTVLRVFRTYPERWAIPTVVLALGAVFYAARYTPLWESSQIITVRDDIGSAEDSPLDRLPSASVAPSTMLAILRGPEVVRAALEQLHGPDAPPALNEELESVQERVELRSPPADPAAGAMPLTLIVADTNAHRARHLGQALFQQLDRRLSTFHRERLAAVVEQRRNAVRLAVEQLDEATTALADLERGPGGELPDDSTPHNLTVGSPGLNELIVDNRRHLEQVELQLRRDRKLLALLGSRLGNTDNLITIPNGLIAARPELGKIKSALIEAQLTTARAIATLAEHHPQVAAARAAERRLAAQLEAELGGLKSAFAADIQLLEDERLHLTSRQAVWNRQLARTATWNRTYAAAADRVRGRAAQVHEAEAALVRAQTVLSATGPGGALVQWDPPRVGPEPRGFSKSAIVFGGLAGGILIGLGLLVLTVAPKEWTTATAGGLPSDRESSPRFVGNDGHDLTLKQALSRLHRFGPPWN